jgi:outer membrane protein assembly factor BamB
MEHVMNSRRIKRAQVIVVVTLAALAATSVLPARAGGVEWPEFRYGPAHDGFTMSSSIDTSNVKTLRQRWTFGSGLQQSDPVVGLGQVYFIAGNRLVALAEGDGHKNWSHPWSGLSDPAHFEACSRAICQNLLYAVRSAPNAGLTALYAETGKIGWSFSYPGLSSPTVGLSDGTVYVSSSNGTVLALRSVGCNLTAPASNRPCHAKVLWKVSPTANAKCPPRPRSCPGINSVTPTAYRGLIYVTSTNGWVYALGMNRGKIAWSTNLKDKGPGTTSTAVSAGHLLVATNNG